MKTPNQLIKIENMTKKFPGVIALDNVNIDLKEGEVHAIMGENGAGKSTLMKIIAGVHKPTSGKYYLKGEETALSSTKEAQDRGISIIYQELNLIPQTSVAENIFLGREPTNNLGKIDWKTLYENADKLLNDLGVNLDSKEKVDNLSIANKQMVEIAKAISFNSQIIIMDEPTSALEDDEINYLFKIINDLRENNVGIFYISHKMDEIFDIADRITVFRDGKYIKTMDSSNTDMNELVKLMVGRKIENIFPERKIDPGKTIMEVDDLSLDGKLKKINFNLKKGEILGVAGLEGCGKIDLGKAIFGYYPKTTGKIKIKNKHIEMKNTNTAINSKIALVPEDRKEGGLILDRGVKENITLSSLDKVSTTFRINQKKEKAIAKNAIKNLRIKTPNINQPTKLLSGGNQQKVVLSKWLETNPEILILLEPTRGIDIGSKAEIYNLINNLTNEGISIIYVSSELTELVGICDRVLVMHEGSCSGILCGKDINQERIMYLSSGGEMDAE